MAAYTTIDDPEAHFQVNTYTGDGNDNRDLVLPGDTDMQPDMIWTKNRDTTDPHTIVDAVRGGGETIYPNDSGGEDTHGLGLTAFNSDGYRVRTGANWNTNTEDYVAWCWKANGSGSSDTNGTINSTATSANTTAGFSIVTYTGDGNAGATIGHGLGAVPDLMINKSRSDADNWTTFHNTLGNGKFLKLDTSAAVTTETTIWNDTSPTSTVFSVGSHDRVNESGDSFVTYLWTGIQGFSKFGSYVANNSVDGPMIWLGFKPAYLMIKEHNNSEAWIVWDNKRDPHNEVQKTLVPNNTNAEDTSSTNDDIDFLSNGFKIRCTSYINNSGGEYIYIAFAEAPFVNSEGVPCNAR